MRTTGFTHDILLLFAGPIVWAVHFVSIYAFTGVACARPLAQLRWMGLDWTGWVIVGAGALAVAALALCARVHPHSQIDGTRRFLRHCSLGLMALSLLAIAFETSAVFLVPVCQR